MKSLTSILIILFVMLSSPLFSWEFGVKKSYACFRDSSQTPIKVSVEKLGDIKITFEQYPVEYKFISFGSDGSGSPQLISGGIWLSEVYDQESIKNFVQGNALNTDWILPAIVVFYPEAKRLYYGIVGKFSYQMECVDL